MNITFKSIPSLKKTLFLHEALTKTATAKILIIDDEQQILDSFTWLLEDCGYSVVTTRKCQEGLDEFRRSMMSHFKNCFMINLSFKDTHALCY